jgi:pyruvate dehydrogenase E2 component (dihydrolipoamide acetyltransferase)
VSTDVTMPQLGETVAEGTVIKWLKNIGDTVAENEPLLEVSTDKVDTEVVSPASGTLAEILIAEEVTVAVGTVIGRLSAPPQPRSGPAAPPAQKAAMQSQTTGTPTSAAPVSSPPALAARPAEAGARSGPRHRHSPRVRRLAHDHGIDADRLIGSGPGARVTPDDVVSAARTVAVVATPPETSTAQSTAPMSAPIAGTPATAVVEADVTALMVRSGTGSNGPSAVATVVGSVAAAALRELTSARGNPFRSLGIALTGNHPDRVTVIADARDLTVQALQRRIDDVFGGLDGEAVTVDIAGADLIVGSAPPGILLHSTPSGAGTNIVVSVGSPVERPIVVRVAGSAPMIGIRWMAYLSLAYDRQSVTSFEAAVILNAISRRIEAPAEADG